MIDWKNPYPSFMCKPPQFITRFPLMPGAGECNEFAMVDTEGEELEFELWTGIELAMTNLASEEGVAWAKAYCKDVGRSSPTCQAIETGTKAEQVQAIQTIVCEGGMGCQSGSSSCPCGPPESISSLLLGFVKPAGEKLGSVKVKRGNAGLFIVHGDGKTYKLSTFSGDSSLVNAICKQNGFPILPVKPNKPNQTKQTIPSSKAISNTTKPQKTFKWSNCRNCWRICSISCDHYCALSCHFSP